MHMARLRHVVVGDGAMHGAAVVPEHDIAQVPSVTIDEFMPGRMFEQETQDSVSLRLAQADDAARESRIDVKRLAARAGMGADDRKIGRASCRERVCKYV